MKTFLTKIRRTLLWCIVLVMPVGIEVDPEHTGELSFSVHGGGGHVMSTLRDCSGDVIATEKQPFKDAVAAVQYSHRFENDLVTVIGVRAGVITADVHWAQRNYGSGRSIPENEISETYLNPYVALESQYVGLGIGYISAELPAILGRYEEFEPFSGHLRLGNHEKLHVLATLNENLPMASGGGYYNLGLGYPIGKRVRSFTGLSAGFYENIGVVQQLSIRISDRFDLELSARGGSSGDEFEGGVAAGVRYHLPLY